MKTFIIIFSSLFIISCNNEPKQVDTFDVNAAIEKAMAELPKPVDSTEFLSHKTFILISDLDSDLNECQSENLTFIKYKLDKELAEEIKIRIHEFYLKNRKDYETGMKIAGAQKKEIESMLPSNTSPDSLTKAYKPAIILIQNKQKCNKGKISIVFDCDWDFEHGLGVVIENWKVKEVSISDIAYF